MYCNHNNPSISIQSGGRACVCVCFKPSRVCQGRAWMGGYADGWMDCLFTRATRVRLSSKRVRLRHGDGSRRKKYRFV